MAEDGTVNPWTGDIVFRAGSENRRTVDPRSIIDLGRSGLTMIGVDPDLIPVLKIPEIDFVTPAETPDTNQ